MKCLFCFNVREMSDQHCFNVYYPSSLDWPRNHSVMFVNAKNVHKLGVLESVKHCLVYVPLLTQVSPEADRFNLIIRCEDPRTEYCLFFRNNHIQNLPPVERVKYVDGAAIAEGAVVGENTVIMPMAYIGGEVVIGDNCYIGVGTRIVGKVKIGDNVIIRENSVIGADGLSTDRDRSGKAATMPQFGGVLIEDDVQIGALTVIARGAIDDTVIEKGVKIDNSSFISHNVRVGADTFIVGESIMFGGSSTGARTFLSGNSTIRNKVVIGDDAIVGMGSVVTKDVAANTVVMGNPAHKKE